jgi:DNA-binding beta-propeller fold protein YncE
LLTLPIVVGVLASSAAAQYRRIETIAGNGQAGPFRSQGRANVLAVSNPFGIQRLPDGGLVIASYDQHVVYRVDSGYSAMEVIAGTGSAGINGRSGDHAVKVMLNAPHEVQVDSQGNIYVADTSNHRVGMIEANTGRWRVIAGTGERGFSGDGGLAHEAKLDQAYSIALDGDRLLIADLGNHRIRQVDLQTSLITTICGTGQQNAPVEGGRAVEQSLAGPRSLAVDPQNIWIVLREGNSVWRIDRSNNRMYHVAGTGEKGFSGDGEGARLAKLNGPKGIAVDPGLAVYVVDTENHAIRVIDLGSQRIRTLVGSPRGEAGFNGDGDELTKRLLKRPHGVCLLPNGDLVIGDSENHRVRILTQ